MILIAVIKCYNIRVYCTICWSEFRLWHGAGTRDLRRAPRHKAAGQVAQEHAPGRKLVRRASADKDNDTIGRI